MKLFIDKEIFERFPGVRLGVVVALGVDNSKEGVFLDFLRKGEIEAQKSLRLWRFPNTH